MTVLGARVLRLPFFTTAAAVVEARLVDAAIAACAADGRVQVRRVLTRAALRTGDLGLLVVDGRFFVLLVAPGARRILNTLLVHAAGGDAQ